MQMLRNKKSWEFGFVFAVCGWKKLKIFLYFLSLWVNYYLFVRSRRHRCTAVARHTIFAIIGGIEEIMENARKSIVSLCRVSPREKETFSFVCVNLCECESLSANCPRIRINSKAEEKKNRKTTIAADRVHTSRLVALIVWENFTIKLKTIPWTATASLYQNQYWNRPHNTHR